MSEPATCTPPNVRGWERSASIAAGLYLLGRGVRRGGFGGLLQAALGGLAMARGCTGRCAVKQALLEAPQQRQDRSPQLEVSGSDLQDLRHNAEAATASATVTGSPPLTSEAGTPNG